MKQIKGFLIAVLAMVLTVAIFFGIADHRLNTLPEGYWRKNMDTAKFFDLKLLRRFTDEKTVCLMGSSELNSDVTKPYGPYGYFRSDRTRILTLGVAGYQSLLQATLLGALSSDIKGPVFLLVSPQWFTDNGLKPEIIPAKLGFRVFHEFLNNKKISEKTKDRLAQRILEMTKAYKNYYAQAEAVYTAYRKKRPDRVVEAQTIMFLESVNTRLTLLKDTRSVSTDEPETVQETEPFNREKMMEEAEKRLQPHAQGNPFMCDKGYYQQFIAPRLQKFKDFEKNQNYLDSQEFNDLSLYLEIAKELNMPVHVISLPWHGKWMDYCGLPKEKRYAYYDKVQETVKKYGFDCVDMRQYEYSPYFFKDIMHLSEKGWVPIDGQILRVFQTQMEH